MNATCCLNFMYCSKLFLRPVATSGHEPNLVQTFLHLHFTGSKAQPSPTPTGLHTSLAPSERHPQYHVYACPSLRPLPPASRHLLSSGIDSLDLASTDGGSRPPGCHAPRPAASQHQRGDPVSPPACQPHRGLDAAPAPGNSAARDFPISEKLYMSHARQNSPPSEAAHVAFSPRESVS